MKFKKILLLVGLTHCFYIRFVWHLKTIFNFRGLGRRGNCSDQRRIIARRRGGGGDVLPFPYKRLMGMCCWMGSHFDDWIDYNRIAFSIEFLEWGGTFSDFWGI